MRAGDRFQPRAFWKEHQRRCPNSRQGTEISGLVSGERGQNRTVNLLIKSQLLCKLSYAPTSGGRLSVSGEDSLLWVG